MRANMFANTKIGNNKTKTDSHLLKTGPSVGSSTDVLIETEVVLSPNNPHRRLLQEPIRNLSWVEGVPKTTVENPDGDTINLIGAIGCSKYNMDSWWWW